MENTQDKKKLYIISFGDTRHYRMRPQEDLHDFAEYEKRLNAYLASYFPGETFAYFTTPRLETVDADRETEFSDYPYLDDEAIDQIEHELLREVQVMHAEKQLDDNAPWTNI